MTHVLTQEKQQINRHEWLLRRNCSLTPRQTIRAFALLCALSLAVGVIFMLLHGAWLVLWFSVIELVAVGVGFLHYARHATDRDYLALHGDCLLVEQVRAGSVLQTRLDASRLRVTPPRHGSEMIVLESAGARVEIGRFVDMAVRRRIAQELSASGSPGDTPGGPSWT